jgi:nuclear transport factor 2 (NTF2) superfamily protein
MSFDPVAALKAYHAALDAHDVDRVEMMLALNATYTSAAVGVVEGRDAIVAAMRKYFAAHEDHRAWDDAIKATGPRQAHSVWQLKATHTASGQTFHRRGEETVTFDANGLVLAVVVKDNEDV